MKRKMSFTAHLIHSMMRCVPNRIEIPRQNTAAAHYTYNSELIEQISITVKEDFGMAMTDRVKQEVGMLLKMAHARKKEYKSYYLVWIDREHRKEIPVDFDETRAFVADSQGKRYTEEEVLELRKKITGKLMHGISFEIRWEWVMPQQPPETD